MSAGDLMNDPYYARIMFRIEGHIHDYDVKVRTDEGFEIKDSDIKSALRKAVAVLRGTGSLRPPKGQRERIRGALTIELVGVFESEANSGGPTRKEFNDAILAVEDSLKLRREAAGHSRGYLDFLSEFIPDARG